MKTHNYKEYTIHDFRPSSSGWGWNIISTFTKSNNGKNYYDMLVIGKGIKKGDLLLRISNKDVRTYLQVDEIEYDSNPKDMCKVISYQSFVEDGTDKEWEEYFNNN